MNYFLTFKRHVIFLYAFAGSTMAFLLSDSNAGYAMYVWRDGYDASIPGCTTADFMKWDKNGPCFSHTWDTQSKRQWLWDTCNLRGREVQKIFLADVHHKLRDGFRSGSCQSSGIQTIKQTLRDGHHHVQGLKIYALFAVSDIAVSEKDLVPYVVWYNDNCAAANERFDGVAVNNEAYAPIKCQDGDTEQLKYLANLKAIKTEALKQQNGRLLTHYSVSWHWGRCGGTQKMMTFDGKTQDAVHHMMDIFDSIDVQVGYITFPAISDRLKLAGYQHALNTGKEIFVTLYTNKGDPCQTTFFPTQCSKGNHTEAGMFDVFDHFASQGISQAKPCIHYFRGIYSSGGNPDWPRH